MSTNTVDTANQFLAENAKLSAEVARLNEQVRALAAESELKSEQNKFLALENDRLQTIIYKNILPYRQQGFIPGGIDELVAATSRHMDEIKREVGARAVDEVIDKAIDAMVRSGAQTFGDCIVAVNSIRAGEVQP